MADNFFERRRSVNNGSINSHTNDRTNEEQTPLLQGDTSLSVSSYSIVQTMNAKNPPNKALIGFWSFVFISYFCSSGGPYGLEGAVKAGYPMMTLILTMIIPWVWSLPLGLMTAELSTSLKSNAGIIFWTKTAFGPFAGFLFGGLSWMNIVMNNALYPSLFISYLSHLFHRHSIIDQPPLHISLQIIFMLVIMLFNLAGVDFIARVATISGILITFPFIIMFVWSGATHHIRPHDWMVLPETIDLEKFTVCLNVLIWNYSGYDFAGSIAEEVKDLKRNFPRGMLVSVFITMVFYMLAVVGSVGIVRDYSLWGEGYFGVLAGRLGGEGLRVTMIVGGVIASVGSYNALLCACSQQLRALGEPDLLDSKILAWKHPRFDTPWTATFLNTALIMIFCFFLPFEKLIELQNIVYSGMLIAEYAALIKLRFTHKDLERPYQITKSVWPTLLMFIIPVLMCGFLIVSACISSLVQLGTTSGIVAFLTVTYVISNIIKKQRKKRKLQECFTDREEEEEINHDNEH